MVRSKSFSVRSARRVIVAGLLAALMAVPLVPFGATAGPTTAREDVEALLAANGGAWEDLADFGELVTVDVATGVETVEIVSIEEALALIDEMRPPPATQDPDPTTHVAAGGLFHACTHGQRRCYVYEVVHDTNPTYGNAKALWNANLGAAGPWPFAHSTLLRVSGDYGAPGFGSGSHAANNTGAGRPSIDTGQTGLLGTGAGHSDKDLHGYGLGSLRMIVVPWGQNLVISYGRLSVHGAFAFCNVANADQCQTVEQTADELGL